VAPPEGNHPKGSSQEQLQVSLTELRARLLSEKGLRRGLEQKLALLQAQSVPQVEEVADAGDAIQGTADRLVGERPGVAKGIQIGHDLEEALKDVRLLAVFEVISERVKLGELDAALEDLLFVEAALQAPRGEGPLAGLEPFFDGVLGYWIPQVLASCQGAGDEWVQLFIKIREMGWDGAARGPLLKSFQIDEFLALATFSITDLSAETEASLLRHMQRCFEEHGWLSRAELAALSRVSGEPVVRFLEHLWERATSNRDGVLCALTQVPDPAAEALLRRIMPEIRDLKLRSALEIWLNR